MAFANGARPPGELFMVTDFGPLTNPEQTLEDVDLTVLAATSVLSDLIDKCPPAEACRDAFERMSKATIKMCMNTTGFGSQIKFSKQQNHPPIVQHHLDHQLPPQSGFMGAPSRPPPRFDDNWKDLFPESWLTSDGRSSENMMSSWQSPTQPQPAYATHRFLIPSANVSLMSNSVDPTSRPVANPEHPQYPRAQQNPDLFAQNNTSMINEQNALPSYDIYDFDFLMSNGSSNTVNHFTGDSGLNLGFDGSHDWADGGDAQFPDLFGGFFFGGSAGEALDVDAVAGGYPSTGDFGDVQRSADGSIWNEAQEQ